MNKTTELDEAIYNSIVSKIGSEMSCKVITSAEIHESISEMPDNKFSPDEINVMISWLVDEGFISEVDTEVYKIGELPPGPVVL